MKWPQVVALAVMLLAVSGAAAGDLAVSSHIDSAPAEVAAQLKALLASGGTRVKTGGATLDFWWVRALPLGRGGDTASWATVEEGTFVGAVRLSRPHLDIRGRTIKPGVYTLRYALQPQNGDHLGVSPFREFLLISPAAADSSAAPTGHESAVELSAKTVGISHPAVWSLDPPVAQEEPLKVHTNAAGQTAVVFEVPLSRDGKSAGTMRFGVILIGTIEA